MIEQLKRLNAQLPAAPWSVSPWSKELPGGKEKSYPNRIRNAEDKTLLHARCGDPMTSSSLEVAENICTLRNLLSSLVLQSGDNQIAIADDLNSDWNQVTPKRGQRIEAVLGDGKIIQGAYSGQYRACWIIDDEDVGWVIRWRVLPVENIIHNEDSRLGGQSSEPHPTVVEDEQR